MGVGGQCHAPAALTPGKNRCLLYKSLVGPQGRSGWVRKISPPSDSISGLSSPLRVAIPSALSRPTSVINTPQIMKLLTPQIMNLLKYLHFLIICLWGEGEICMKLWGPAAGWTICWVVLWFAINCNPPNYVHRVLRKSMDGIWLMRTPANISIGYTCSNLPASLNSSQLHRLIRLPILGDLISFLFK